PPLLLGLVLGPLAENRLFLSTDNYGLAWMWFPSVLVIFAIILAGTFYPLFQRLRERRKNPQAEKATTPAPVSGWAPIFSLLVVVLFAWALWEAWDWGFRARLFPWAVGFMGLALGLAQLDLDITGFLKKGVKALHTEVSSETALVARRTASIVGWILVFFFAIWLLGFSWAIVVATSLYLKVGAGEKWLITIILTLVAFGSFYGLFIHVLHVPFPDGLLFEWWAG
ncbi:MAG: tripartite tricarboxylate transporter TctB family protein, partial [Candidatus Binatia bacterium]